MDEKENNKPADKNNDDGNIPENTSLIKQANAAAERLENANKERKEIINQETEIINRKLVSGRSEGGITPKEETADEKWAREAKVRYAGTGMDPTE